MAILRQSDYHIDNSIQLRHIHLHTQSESLNRINIKFSAYSGMNGLLSGLVESSSFLRVNNCHFLNQLYE